MGYPTSDNQGIDWSQMLREGDYGKAQAVAKREAANALAWKQRAEELEKQLFKSLEGQHTLLNQRDAWKLTAKHVFERAFSGRDLEELCKEYDRNKAKIFAEKPYDGPKG